MCVLRENVTSSCGIMRHTLVVHACFTLICGHIVIWTSVLDILIRREHEPRVMYILITHVSTV